MISRISKGYWIWGQFDIKSTKLLTSLYQNINNKLDGPKFDVHLTISGPFFYNKEIHTQVFESLSERYAQFNIQLNGMGHKNEFFQSLFINVVENEILKTLKNSIDQSFNIEKVSYFPHISLFYGNKDTALKTETVKGLKIPKHVRLDRLSIVKVDEEVKLWKVLKSYSLFQNQ